MKQPIDPRNLRDKMLAGFESQWKPFFWQGVLLMVLGILAILVPGYATLATEFLLGWLMLGGGAIRLLGAMHARRTPGARWQIISAALLLVLGLLLILHPLADVITLTQMLILFLLLHAIGSFLFSFRAGLLSRNWLIAVSSGASDIVLIGIIAAGWLGASHWALGCILFLLGLVLTLVLLYRRNVE